MLAQVEMRTYRMGLIQTEEQLRFSVDAIVEGLKMLMTGVGMIIQKKYCANLPDDQGRHDVVERVELRLAAQHQRVLDVGEVLQHLQEKISISTLRCPERLRKR